MSCGDIFGILHPKPDNSACRRIASLAPNCTCENESVRPGFSPGKVENDEIIIRFIRNDEKYFDCKKQEILGNNFDLVKSRGMSVNRIKHADNSALYAQQIAGNYVGYVEVEVGRIRALLHHPDPDYPTDYGNVVTQVFAIYDTALDDNRAHADVCQNVFSNPAPGKGSLILKFRRDLQEAFGSNLKHFLPTHDTVGK